MSEGSAGRRRHGEAAGVRLRALHPILAVPTALVDGEVAAWSDSTAGELSDLIHMLVSARMVMADAVPAGLDPGARVPTVGNPAWRTTRNPTTNAVLLALRHPGHGWTGFEFPEPEARALLEWLTKAGQR